MAAFAPGTVGYFLSLMQGIWHDHVCIYDLSGQPLSEDTLAGSPGAAPFDNLVYIEFDGQHYQQTNVTFRGRPLHVRSFRGELKNGILHFDSLGPDDPGHIGVAAGPHTLAFMPAKLDGASLRYSEPDFIHLPGPQQRSRTTVLYRQGVAVRTLNAQGVKLAPSAIQRHPLDPRGPDGPVHAERSVTQVFTDPPRRADHD